MTACSRGHYKIVQYLIYEAYADIFCKNNGGEMAYDIASSNFESDICEILIKAELEKFELNDYNGNFIIQLPLYIYIYIYF